MNIMVVIYHKDHEAVKLNNKGKCIIGNCEEELPKKPVGRLSVNCRPSVDRQVTDSLPTVNQQVTDRL